MLDSENSDEKLSFNPGINLFTKFIWLQFLDSFPSQTPTVSQSIIDVDVGFQTMLLDLRFGFRGFNL